MKEKLTNGVILALAILGGLFIVLTIYFAVTANNDTSYTKDDVEVKVQQDYTPSSPVAGLSKSEYIDLATRNCSKTESESFCRCYYTLFMENNSVEETFRQDAAAADPNYVYTDEQLNIAAKCIGN